jgi:hypothetical protein
VSRQRRPPPDVFPLVRVVLSGHLHRIVRVYPPEDRGPFPDFVLAGVRCRVVHCGDQCYEAVVEPLTWLVLSPWQKTEIRDSRCSLTFPEPEDWLAAIAFIADHRVIGERVGRWSFYAGVYEYDQDCRPHVIVSDFHNHMSQRLALQYKHQYECYTWGHFRGNNIFRLELVMSSPYNATLRILPLSRDLKPYNGPRSGECIVRLHIDPNDYVPVSIPPPQLSEPARWDEAHRPIGSPVFLRDSSSGQFGSYPSFEGDDEQE